MVLKILSENTFCSEFNKKCTKGFLRRLRTKNSASQDSRMKEKIAWEEIKLHTLKHPHQHHNLLI